MKLVELDLILTFTRKVLEDLEIFKIIYVFCIYEIVKVIVLFRVFICDTPILAWNVKGILALQILAE